MNKNNWYENYWDFLLKEDGVDVKWGVDVFFWLIIIGFEMY